MGNGRHIRARALGEIAIRYADTRKMADFCENVIALSLPFAEQQAVINWYDSIGQPYRVEKFGWIGWQGIFTTDPEGNIVELVAYDASLKDSG